MTMSVSRRYAYSTFPMGSLERASEAICDLPDLGRVAIYGSYIHDEGVKESKDFNHGDLATVVNLQPPLENVCWYGMDSFKRTIYIIIQRYGEDQLSIHSEAPSLSLCTKTLAILETELQLEEMSDKAPGTALNVSHPNKGSSDKDNAPSLKQSELEFPSKVTIRWLFDHMPIRLWFAGFSILIAVFMFGVAIGQSKFFQEAVKLFSNSEQVQADSTSIENGVRVLFQGMEGTVQNSVSQ